MEYAYKVLFKNSESELRSVTGDFEGSITYVPGKAVRPLAGCGPLAVFDSYDNASSFAIQTFSRWVKLVIYVVRYERSKETNLWATGRTEIVKLKDCPSGTILASEVTLVDLLIEVGGAE